MNSKKYLEKPAIKQKATNEEHKKKQKVFQN